MTEWMSGEHVIQHDCVLCGDLPYPVLRALLNHAASTSGSGGGLSAAAVRTVKHFIGMVSVCVASRESTEDSLHSSQNAVSGCAASPVDGLKTTTAAQAALVTTVEHLRDARLSQLQGRAAPSALEGISEAITGVPPGDPRVLLPAAPAAPSLVTRAPPSLSTPVPLQPAPRIGVELSWQFWDIAAAAREQAAIARALGLLDADRIGDQSGEEYGIP